MHGEKNRICHLNCDLLNLWTKSYHVTIQRKPLLAKCNNLFIFTKWNWFFLLFLNFLLRHGQEWNRYKEHKQAKVKSCVNSHGLFSSLHSTVADPGEGPREACPPFFSRPNWGPKGWKKFFRDQPPPLPPPLISGSGWLGSPLSQGLDPALLNTGLSLHKNWQIVKLVLIIVFHN